MPTKIYVFNALKNNSRLRLLAASTLLRCVSNDLNQAAYTSDLFSWLSSGCVALRTSHDSFLQMLSRFTSHHRLYIAHYTTTLYWYSVIKQTGETMFSLVENSPFFRIKFTWLCEVFSVFEVSPLRMQRRYSELSHGTSPWNTLKLSEPRTALSHI